MISFTVKTRSTLFIGGIPKTFEIGGVDLYTATDHESKPCIPASSLKGALRVVVRDHIDSQNGKEIKTFYQEYLKREFEKNQEKAKDLLKNTPEKITKYEKEIKEKIEAASAEYLFGIEGFNNTPKIIFSDLLLDSNDADDKKWFTIDAKNAITENGDSVTSNPRIYKSVQPGLTFNGVIRFHRIQLLGDCAEESCKNFLQECLGIFNEGIYRLGNSKSRGYGWIEVTIKGEKEKE